MCKRLDKISADADVPVPWCLPRALLDCAKPPLAAYLMEWGRADACDEAYVRGTARRALLRSSFETALP